jgi:threonine/homoserine/homoserine lactone efflux protein
VAQRPTGRQGSSSNTTGPEVLVFSLSVLPQFHGAGAGVPALVLLALIHAVLSSTYNCS